jgi:hypothetical protein
VIYGRILAAGNTQWRYPQAFQLLTLAPGADRLRDKGTQRPAT